MNKFKLQYVICSALLLILLQVNGQDNGSEKKQWKFDFGNGQTKEGYIQVGTETAYSEDLTYGVTSSDGSLESYQAKKGDALSYDCVTSDKAFFFTVDLPEGRYKVTTALGNPMAKSTTTVRAEARRLMVEKAVVRKGKNVARTFIVDVRRPKIDEEIRVRLKKREFGSPNWDKRLSLEFNGTNPSVSSITIEEANDAPVFFLAGNSTVTDQDHEPWASWGQMLPAFLNNNTVVANHAQSGLTLISFKYQNRLKKIVSVMKPGDYLFVEFAHNDQKKGSCHVEPYTTYQDELRYFASEVKKIGGIPVFVTSTNRRQFDDEGNLINTLSDYPEAMRQLAKEENIMLIDLNARTKELYEALGVEGSKNVFVHYPANTFPGQIKQLADNTHFNTYGAYELAKCVVQEMLDNHPQLAKYVSDDFGRFNANKPDKFKNFYWPLSPAIDMVKPDGN